MSLDRCGQLYGQLIQICDVHKGITIDSLDVLFVLADSGRNEQYSLAPVLLLDAAEIFLGGTAVVAGCCRLGAAGHYRGTGRQFAFPQACANRAAMPPRTIYQR